MDLWINLGKYTGISQIKLVKKFIISALGRKHGLQLTALRDKCVYKDDSHKADNAKHVTM